MIPVLPTTHCEQPSRLRTASAMMRGRAHWLRVARRWLRISVAVVLSYMPYALPAAADSFSSEQLAELLMRTGSSTVRYSETQYRRALTRPLQQTGELIFMPPNRFEKRVLTPAAESFRIQGDTLVIEQAGRKPRQISMRNQPALRGLLLSFQAIVSGRLAELTPYYQSQVTGSASNWSLQLTPIDADIKRYVAGISITGNHHEPSRFEVTETNGDRIVTVIEP